MARPIGFVSGVRKTDSREYLLVTLGNLGGEATPEEVFKSLEEFLGKILTDLDWKPYRTDEDNGTPRWRKFVTYAQQELAEQELMKVSSTLWEITDKGQEELDKVLQQWAITRFADQVRERIVHAW